MSTKTLIIVVEEAKNVENKKNFLMKRNLHLLTQNVRLYFSINRLISNSYELRNSDWLGGPILPHKSHKPRRLLFPTQSQLSSLYS